jgi:DNA-binding transcriptional ArsR family regulator
LKYKEALIQAVLYGLGYGVRELKQALRALGDVSRLRIVEVLGDGTEQRVSDLALKLKISQPLVSWHLGFLRRAGLVHTRRQGRTAYCSLNWERWQWLLTELARLTNAAPGGPAPTDPRTPVSLFEESR